MNNTLYIIMFALIIYMLIKNAKNAKNVRKDQAYIDAYMKVLKNEEDSASNLKNYLESENDEELNNRAKLVAIYQEMVNSGDYESLLNSLDINKAFFGSEKVNLEKVTTNSDSFIWLALNMALAHEQNKDEIIDNYFKPLLLHDQELNMVVEYALCKAIYEYFKEGKEEALIFPKKLLSGEYAGYHYDKQLIGVFKKMAAALLAYAKQALDDDCLSILVEFSTTQVGNKFMKHLGILDAYLPKKEEEKTEENTNE